MYKLNENSITRLSDGACIPMDDRNSDYIEYKQWLAEGNIPQPQYTAEELAIKKATEKMSLVTNTIQSFLDSKAKEKGYDNILSACSYAGHTNPFQTEGQTFVTWRGDVWAYCYQVLNAVKAGTRTEPTIDELVVELPQLVLGA